MPKKRIHKPESLQNSPKKVHSKHKAEEKQVRGLLGMGYGVSLRTKILFLIGLLLIIVPTFFYLNEGIQLAFFTPKVIPVVNSYPLPTEIIIPQVQMDLPIQETAISRGVWEIAGDAISHLTISARPGEKGTMILYGHNTNDRFGPIRWLSAGQTLTIVTKDAKKHTYTIVETKDVGPSDVSVLAARKTETLILYTCDGFADLQRFIVLARPS